MIFLLSFIFSPTLGTAQTLGEFYQESINIRIEGKKIIAPKKILIQPDQYQFYQIALQWTDDFKALQASSGIKNKILDYLNPFPESVSATLTCDQPFDFYNDVPNYFSIKEKQVKTQRFRLYKTRPGSARAYIAPSTFTRGCTLSVKDDRSKSPTFNQSFSVSLQNEPATTAYLDHLAKEASGCTFINNFFKDPYLQAFKELNGDQVTCASSVEEIKNLENKIDGLQGKMSVLLGAPLSEEFLAKKNAYAPLDFSKAPKLDAVLISYLVFRADYTGTLLSRALEFHAQRGTQVRILVSDVISLDKDKALFDRLMSVSPNIKVQLYRWNSVEDSGHGDLFDSYHRSVHSKLFIALSKYDPSANKLIHGGRNVHDGFALGKAVLTDNNPPSPYVVYGGDKNADESWASWRDFELEISQPEFVQEVAKHFLKLWNRNAETTQISYLRKYNTGQVINELQMPYALIKHMVSVPFQDERNLEKVYEKLINSAKKEIFLTSPYLRPPERVFNALLRAVDRGVKLKIITRIDLQGDTADDFLEEVNKNAINRLFENSEVYEYTVKGEILHSKLMIIDGSVSFVSSVNLNHRSFIHDIEDGLLIYSPAYAQRLLTLVDGYKTETRLVTQKVKTVWWRKVVVDIFKREF